MIFGVGNVIAGIFMFGILFKIQNKTILQTTQKIQAKKRLNTLTLVTLTSDFFCNFSPHIIDILFRFGGINISEHIGPYSSILGAIHSILIAQLYYSRLKLNGQTTSNIISETPQNKIRPAPII
uniref:Uncharacterized protein n=1 Tax=Panagrolaimus davidi TaxID=227884 RepID=A0A914PZE6_9BILA